MTTQVADRVQETSTTTGTGNFTLAGAAAGYQAWATAFSTGASVGYCITDGTDWEVGIGTFTTGPSTLARTTVTSSSNGGSLVNFAASTKQVFSTYSQSLMNALPFAGVKTQTATTYTALTGDKGKLVSHSNASPIAVTQPQAGASNGFPSATDPGGAWYCWVQNRGAGAVTITPTTSTIDGAATLVLTTGQGALIASDGTNYFTVHTTVGNSLVDFTDNLIVATPNATVPIAQLLATNAASNVDFAISPKGTGAIVRKIADNGVTNGNKCGTGAVDLQSATSGAATAVASGTTSALVAGAGNTASNTNAIGAGGSNNTASGSTSGTFGGNACTATQAGAATLGGNSCNSTASGAATLGGATLAASGAQSIASGSQCTASGAQALAMGNQNTADAIASLAFGNNSRVRTMLGAHAHQSSAALDGVAGSRQSRRITMQCNLTTNAAVSMTTDGGAAGTTNIPCLPTNTGMAIDCQVTIRNPANGDCGQFRFRAMVKNVSGTVTLSGTPVADAYMGDASLSACTLSAIADNTNKGLLVQPVGLSSTPLKASLEGTTCEVGG